MPTIEKCLCCKEVSQITHLLEHPYTIDCVTEHVGFESVCLLGFFKSATINLDSIMAEKKDVHSTSQCLIIIITANKEIILIL